MNHQEEIIDIKGMHCKSCADLIELKISLLDGVESIKVSLIENKAFVRFDPTKISLERIKTEIESLGYSTNSELAKNEEKPIRQGLVYGIIPHIGCILFMVGSILGVTVLTQIFKPLLMSKYFFYILILISLGFATISSAVYLKKNGLLSSAGVKRKKKYLLTMFGSTILINLLFFFIIFPLLANVSLTSASSITGAVVGVNNLETDLSFIKLQVDIPCPGHAPLITGELKTINGVAKVKFSSPNYFDVNYNSAETTKQEILSLDVFKTYKAKVINEFISKLPTQETTSEQESTKGGCSCGGCGG